MEQDDDEEVKVKEQAPWDNEDFIQEEYDLHASLGQIVSRIDPLDEFTYFAESVRQAHGQDS